MKPTEMKTESNSPLLQSIKRSNFIRAASLEWMRINQPDVMAQIEAEAERQYPFTKRSLRSPPPRRAQTVLWNGSIEPNAFRQVCLF
jgi:hypothetical protein